LFEVAKKNMLKLASTVDEYFFAGDGTYDFDTLRNLAKSASDWAKIAFVAANKAEFAEIDNAIARLLEVPDPGYQELIRICHDNPVKGIEPLVIERIKNADIDFNGLMGFNFTICSDSIADVVFEKIIEVMGSISHCRRLHRSSFCPTIRRYRSQQFFVKALTLAQTFDDWEWLRAINNHKDPFAQKIVQGMVATAVTLEQWHKTYRASRPEWPERELAFQKMKELAV